MSKITPLKKRGATFFIFIFLLVFNYTNCYSDTIVPKLDSKTGSSVGWTLNKLPIRNGYWFMNSSDSYAETTLFYDLSCFSEISIESTIGFYYDYNYSSTKIEISEDGINWTLLQKNPFASSSTGNISTFTNTLSYKHAKIRLSAINANADAGARLYSIEITGTAKFISTPKTNVANKITNSSFTANWNNCDNATDYILNVYNKTAGNYEKTILNEDFKEQVIYNEYIDSKLTTYLPGWGGNLTLVVASDYETNKFLKIGTLKAAGYIQTPALNLSGNNGKFEISFDIGSANASSASINLYVNNVPKNLIKINGSNQVANQHINYTLTDGTENCIIKIEGAKENYYAFVIDNIKITQVLDSIETSIPGFPKQVGNTTSYSIDGLSQNTNYYYTVKATNGYITTNESEAVCIKTLPEDQNTVEADEVKIYNDETINGDLRIFDGAKINGKVTVKGEISYVCKFTPSKWHSFSLPFIPKVVGGYINGIAYALRPNHDYFLKSYQNEKFVNSTFNGSGYIIKVLPNIDNGELFFFSDKGITLNENNNIYSINNGYTHLGNPYTYSLSPKELVSADKYYCLKNNKFVESDEDLLPFQSFIVYKGTKLNQTSYEISIEPESVGISTAKAKEIKTWQNEGNLWITGTEDEINIYSSQGKLVYTGYNDGKTPIQLLPGIYLIRTKDLSTKIIIK
nr:fibronectin type III domain-containing protein [uncultured Bacteroides sp.]